MEYKLKFELVPDSCWYSNLRSILPKKAWDFLRAYAKEKSGNKCAICGAKVKRLDTHEVWSYNIKDGVQKLEDVISVCRNCHSVIHIGRTQICGDEEKAEKHFMRVNNATYVEYRQALGEANRLHQERNKVKEWKLDLTWLKQFEK